MDPSFDSFVSYGDVPPGDARAPSAMVEAPTMLPMLSPAPGVHPDDLRDARTGAGIGVVMAATGTGVGFWLGGPCGAGAGLLLVGAARNTLRATRNWKDPDPVRRQDAGTSAALALFGSLIGGYLAYKSYQDR